MGNRSFYADIQSQGDLSLDERALFQSAHILYDAARAVAAVHGTGAMLNGLLTAFTWSAHDAGLEKQAIGHLALIAELLSKPERICVTHPEGRA